MYYQYVKNAVFDVCAKSVPVWGKRGEMRGLITRRKIFLTCDLCTTRDGEVRIPSDFKKCLSDRENKERMFELIKQVWIENVA